MAHGLRRVAEAQHRVQPLIFQQRDKAAFLDHGTQAGVAEEIQQARGLGNAAVGQLGIVEMREGGFIQRAPESHQTGQIRLRRVIDGVNALEPACSLGFAQGGAHAGEPRGVGHGDARVLGKLHLGGGQLMVVADAAHVAVITDTHDGHPYHDERHEHRGENAAQPEFLLEGEKLGNPHHAVEENEQNEDSCTPGQGLHHPLLRRIGDELHISEAVFLEEHPGRYGAGHSYSQQHHLDNTFDKGKDEDGYGQDGKYGQNNVGLVHDVGM